MSEDSDAAHNCDASGVESGVETGGPPYESVELLNERMWREFRRLLDRLRQTDVNDDEAVDRAVELMGEVQAELAPDFAARLLADGRTWVNQTREYTSGFEERLRFQWGQALDLYMVIVGTVEWASKACIVRNRERTEAELDALFEVLAQLNGQALRVAREVHTLLASGYGLGALALSRTVYEIAVRACVLSEYGRVEGNEDLAERFVHHDRVVNLRDAIIYQRDAGTLGYEPFEENYIARLEAEQSRLVELYGKAYEQPYGWAIGLPGVTHGRDFRMLETLAKTVHRRGLYQWSSHVVHADAKALRLGRLGRGGATTVLTGPSNTALADPADHALYALNLTFVQFVSSALPRSAPIDQCIGRALGLLIEEAQAEFVAAEKRVDDAEDKLQAELAEKGQRMTPWGIQG